MRNSSSLDWLRFMHTPNDYRVSPNQRIITAVTQRLEVPAEKVMAHPQFLGGNYL